jgi:hypothetical protein
MHRSGCPRCSLGGEKVNPPRVVWLFFVTCLLTGIPLVGDDGLVMTAEVTDSRYCLGSNGLISFRLTVDFTYRNIGQNPIALPRFSRLAGYALFRNEADLKADRAVARTVLSLPDIFRTLGLDPSDPPLMLFESVPPGGAAGRRGQVLIPLGTLRKPEKGLFGKSLLIQFSLDNWPGRRMGGSGRIVGESRHGDPGTTHYRVRSKAGAVLPTGGLGGTRDGRDVSEFSSESPVVRRTELSPCRDPSMWWLWAHRG